MALNMLAILLIPCLLLVIVLSFHHAEPLYQLQGARSPGAAGLSASRIWIAMRQARHGSRGVLWGGVITAMSGLALLLGLSTIGFGAWLLGGLLPSIRGPGDGADLFYRR